MKKTCRALFLLFAFLHVSAEFAQKCQLVDVSVLDRCWIGFYEDYKNYVTYVARYQELVQCGYEELDFPYHMCKGNVIKNVTTIYHAFQEKVFCESPNTNYFVDVFFHQNVSTKSCLSGKVTLEQCDCENAISDQFIQQQKAILTKYGVKYKKGQNYLLFVSDELEKTLTAVYPYNKKVGYSPNKFQFLYLTSKETAYKVAYNDLVKIRISENPTRNCYELYEATHNSELYQACIGDRVVDHFLIVYPVARKKTVLGFKYSENGPVTHISYSSYVNDICEYATKHAMFDVRYLIKEGNGNALIEATIRRKSLYRRHISYFFRRYSPIDCTIPNQISRDYIIPLIKGDYDTMSVIKEFGYVFAKLQPMKCNHLCTCVVAGEAVHGMYPFGILQYFVDVPRTVFNIYFSINIEGIWLDSLILFLTFAIQWYSKETKFDWIHLVFSSIALFVKFVVYISSYLMWMRINMQYFWTRNEGEDFYYHIANYVSLGFLSISYIVMFNVYVYAIPLVISVSILLNDISVFPFILFVVSLIFYCWTIYNNKGLFTGIVVTLVKYYYLGGDRIKRTQTIPYRWAMRLHYYYNGMVPYHRENSAFSPAGKNALFSQEADPNIANLRYNLCRWASTHRENQVRKIPFQHLPYVPDLGLQSNKPTTYSKSNERVGLVECQSVAINMNVPIGLPNINNCVLPLYTESDGEETRLLFGVCIEVDGTYATFVVPRHVLGPLSSDDMYYTNVNDDVKYKEVYFKFDERVITTTFLRHDKGSAYISYVVRCDDISLYKLPYIQSTVQYPKYVEALICDLSTSNGYSRIILSPYGSYYATTFAGSCGSPIFIVNGDQLELYGLHVLYVDSQPFHYGLCDPLYAKTSIRGDAMLATPIRHLEKALRDELFGRFPHGSPPHYDMAKLVLYWACFENNNISDNLNVREKDYLRGCCYSVSFDYLVRAIEQTKRYSKHVATVVAYRGLHILHKNGTLTTRDGYDVSVLLYNITIDEVLNMCLKSGGAKLGVDDKKNVRETSSYSSIYSNSLLQGITLPAFIRKKVEHPEEIKRPTIQSTPLYVVPLFAYLISLFPTVAWCLTTISTLVYFRANAYSLGLFFSTGDPVQDNQIIHDACVLKLLICYTILPIIMLSMNKCWYPIYFCTYFAFWYLGFTSVKLFTLLSWTFTFFMYFGSKKVLIIAPVLVLLSGFFDVTTLWHELFLKHVVTMIPHRAELFGILHNYHLFNDGGFMSEFLMFNFHTCITYFDVLPMYVYYWLTCFAWRNFWSKLFCRSKRLELQSVVLVPKEGLEAEETPEFRSMLTAAIYFAHISILSLGVYTSTSIDQTLMGEVVSLCMRENSTCAELMDMLKKLLQYGKTLLINISRDSTDGLVSTEIKDLIARLGVDDNSTIINEACHVYEEQEKALYEELFNTEPNNKADLQSFLETVVMFANSNVAPILQSNSIEKILSANLSDVPTTDNEETLIGMYRESVSNFDFVAASIENEKDPKLLTAMRQWKNRNRNYAANLREHIRKHELNLKRSAQQEEYQRLEEVTKRVKLLSLKRAAQRFAIFVMRSEVIVNVPIADVLKNFFGNPEGLYELTKKLEVEHTTSDLVEVEGLKKSHVIFSVYENYTNPEESKIVVTRSSVYDLPTGYIVISVDGKTVFRDMVNLLKEAVTIYPTIKARSDNVIVLQANRFNCVCGKGFQTERDLVIHNSECTKGILDTHNQTPGLQCKCGFKMIIGDVLLPTDSYTHICQSYVSFKPTKNVTYNHENNSIEAYESGKLVMVLATENLKLEDFSVISFSEHVYLHTVKGMQTILRVSIFGYLQRFLQICGDCNKHFITQYGHNCKKKILQNRSVVKVTPHKLQSVSSRGEGMLRVRRFNERSF